MFKVLKLLVLLSVGFMCVISTFTINFEWPQDILYIDRFVYLNRYLVDFLQLCALLLVLHSGNRFSRWLGLILAFVFTIFYFVQSQSFSTTGKYLPSVALENIDHIDFLELDNIIFSGVIWLFLFVFLFSRIFRHVGRIPFRAALIGAILVLVTSILVKNDDDWLSKQTVDQRFEFYNSGKAGVQRKSPIGELLETYLDYLAYLHKQNFISDKADVLSDHGVKFAYENYQFLGADNADYPMVRSTKFDSEIEFLPPSARQAKPRKNIIIFFVEGVSTKLVQPYHDYFQGLTPNINEFSKHAVRVNNYHSHTYATYRALGGQLCSIYPVGRLYKDVSYYCLGHALRDAGYQNHFFVSQRLDNTDLDQVMSKAGFENIYGTEALLALVPDHGSSKKSVLPDRVLFEGVIEKLKQFEEPQQSQPFSLGIYNFETHTGIKPFEPGPRYRGSPDSPRQPNPALDTFYNFDNQFGKFWKYFKHSKHYGNTIVVVTSDHATFPSKDYVDEQRAQNVKQ
jgi:hypothetical protein